MRKVHPGCYGSWDGLSSLYPVWMRRYGVLWCVSPQGLDILRLYDVLFSTFFHWRSSTLSRQPFLLTVLPLLMIKLVSIKGMRTPDHVMLQLWMRETRLQHVTWMID